MHWSLSLVQRTKISSLLMDEKQQQQLTTLLLDIVISELLFTSSCPHVLHVPTALWISHLWKNQKVISNLSSEYCIGLR